MFDYSSAVTRPYHSRLILRIAAMLLAGFVMGGCAYFKTDDDYSDNTAEELYALSQEKMKAGGWESAVEVLRALEAKYPYGVYAEQAQLDTIYCYYKNEDTGLALAAADRFIKLHPTHQSVDYAYYLKGLVSFNEDKSLWGRIMGLDDLSDRDSTAIHNAMVAFEDVYTLFPESQYAPEAKKRVKYLVNALARHEIAVANYYYSRDAYVAAANRAKGVVEQYATTPSVERALAVMMFSYQNMGFDDLALDSRRVLSLNFPESPYLTEDLESVDFTLPPEDLEPEDESWYSSVTRVFSSDDSEASATE